MTSIGFDVWMFNIHAPSAADLLINFRGLLLKLCIN